MMSSTEGTMDGLHELLAERGRYQGWLAQLEQRRATTPQHVLERVRADYDARLQQVTTQLRGRAVELEATTAALRSRLSALASEEEARRDERAETELRASVGEFEPAQAAATISQCDAAISSLTAQRDALGAELARLQDVLVQVMASEPAPPAAPAADVRPSPVSNDNILPMSALEAVSLPGEPVSAPHAEAAAHQSAVEELEFLRSIVSTRDAHSPVSDGQPDQVQPPVLAAPRRQATPMSSSAMPSLRDPLRSAGEASVSPGNMPSFLKDMPTEQVKTLKCQECGTMNYPTEWYCERCGGELAAM
jgi:hypothetical protein